MLGVQDGVVVAGDVRRERPRHRQSFAPARGEAADVEAVGVGGAGARRQDRHVVAGFAQAEGERARGPSGAPRARGVDLAHEQDPHGAILRSTPSSCSQCRAQE